MAGGFRFSVEIDGALAARRAEAAREAALTAAAESVRARSAARAPRRTGAMAGSGSVEIAQGQARIGFGAHYARFQHEHTEWRHPGGGQARFLIEALNAPETARALVEGFRIGN